MSKENTQTTTAMETDVETEHHRSLFCAKMCAITRLFQNALYKRALQVKNKREKIRLLTLHRDVSVSVSRIIG